MSVAYELSSEAAVWLLARRAAPPEPVAATPTEQTRREASNPRELRQIVLELHDTLRRLRRQERAARRSPLA